MVNGEPGIGKTSLIHEALTRSARRGFATLSGRAAEYEQDLPFAVFTEALERQVKAADIERLGVDERHLAPLTSVLPFLGVSGHGPQPVESRAPERHHVLRALHALLEALAAENPVVLALDDLHWADSASIDLVCRLLHRGIIHPSLLLLALRPGQAEIRLRTALWEAERHGLVTWVELQPLSTTESNELLKDIGDRALRKLIYRESGGNPLYLEQLAAAGARQVAPATDDASEIGVPAPVGGAIRAEAEALSPAARTLLEGAAVAGDPFDQALAGAAAGLPQAEALTALDELVDTGLIRPTDAPRRFRFRHPIVRRAVYESAGAGWRLGSHGRVAAALEQRGNPASARASHIERSAEPGDQNAIDVLTQAGHETMRHAPVSAARWFEAASRLIPPDEQHLGQRLSLAGQRATALGIAGRLDEGLEALGEFLALAPPEPTPLRLQVAVFAAIFNELLGRQDAGRRILLDEIGGLADPSGPEAADLKRELAFTYFFDADWAAMAVAARAALACTCQGMVRVGALAALSLAEFGRHNLDDVQDAVTEAGALFDELDDDAVRGHHPGHRGLARLGRGLQRALRGRAPPSRARQRHRPPDGTAPPRGRADVRLQPGARPDRPARTARRPGRDRRRGLAAVHEQPDGELGDDDPLPREPADRRPARGGALRRARRRGRGRPPAARCRGSRACSWPRRCSRSANPRAAARSSPAPTGTRTSRPSRCMRRAASSCSPAPRSRWPTTTPRTGSPSVPRARRAVAR